MKFFKLHFFKVFLLSIFVLYACTNDEPVDQADAAQTEDSPSITESLIQLKTGLNTDGSINLEMNPNANIIFDFCFDFVYPLNLSYNNGTVVAVDDFEDLIDVILNSTDELFINGIEFPFNVEVFNHDTDAIEVVTINDEEAFIDLIEDCAFDAPDCTCPGDYDPVCVEVDTAAGDTFIMTFPNACMAECEGFSEDDFIDDCEDDDYNGGDSIEQCFEFNFPLSFINEAGDTVTVNNQEELDIALYTSYYYEFIYPFSITLNDGSGTVLAVGDEEEFEGILEICYTDGGGNNGGGDDCECFEDFNPVCVEVDTASGTTFEVYPNACFAECFGYTSEDFVQCDDTTNGGGNNDCDTCTDEFDPVCVMVESPSGNQVITFPNECYALCAGFTPNNIVDCDD